MTFKIKGTAASADISRNATKPRNLSRELSLSNWLVILFNVLTTVSGVKVIAAKPEDRFKVDDV